MIRGRLWPLLLVAETVAQHICHGPAACRDKFRQSESLLLDLDGAVHAHLDELNDGWPVLVELKHAAETPMLEVCTIPYCPEEGRCYGDTAYCTQSDTANHLRSMVQQNGYAILRGVLTRTEAQQLRSAVMAGIKPGETAAIPMEGGFAIPLFHTRAEFAHINRAQWLEHPTILWCMEALAHSVGQHRGSRFRFVNQSEITVNDVRSWHQDRLNGEERKFEVSSTISCVLMYYTYHVKGSIIYC